jgi:hypothetical protein
MGAQSAYAKASADPPKPERPGALAKAGRQLKTAICPHCCYWQVLTDYCRTSRGAREN